MGRPSKYREEYNDQAYQMALLSATDKGLADFFKVNKSTITLWKKDYPEFSASLNEAKNELDNQVEKSLFTRAMGYSCPETKVFVIEGKIRTKTITKHFPPDPTSMIFWLKNRQRDKWRDVQEHINKVEVNEISDLEIARTVAFLLTNATQKDTQTIKEIN